MADTQAIPEPVAKLKESLYGGLWDVDWETIWIAGGNKLYLSVTSPDRVFDETIRFTATRSFIKAVGERDAMDIAWTKMCLVMQKRLVAQQRGEARETDTHSDYNDVVAKMDADQNASPVSNASTIRFKNHDMQIVGEMLMYKNGQRLNWPLEHDRQHPESFWIALLTEYLGRVATELTSKTGPADGFVYRLFQLGGMVMNAIESKLPE